MRNVNWNEGWTNYETWNFMLWEGDYLQEIVNELNEETEEKLDHGQVYHMVDGHINNILEEQESTTGFLSDVTGYAVQQINIHEIVENLLKAGDLIE